jgi:hypothetical protein
LLEVILQSEIISKVANMSGNQFSAYTAKRGQALTVGPETGLDKYFYAELDAKKRRLTHHYLGFWTPEIARGVIDQFRVILERVAGPGSLPFTLLDDCRQWELQSKEVAELAHQFVPICADFPIARNAMIVPSSLIRMQVRRTLTNVDFCEVFETYEQADEWLAEVEPRLGG